MLGFPSPPPDSPNYFHNLLKGKSALINLSPASDALHPILQSKVLASLQLQWKSKKSLQAHTPLPPYPKAI